ncbi:MAG: hypothetical protein ACRD19_07190 [Terriglobia bacterium]
MLSYLVAPRNREIGLRMALGAVPSQIRAFWLKGSVFRCSAASPA